MYYVKPIDKDLSRFKLAAYFELKIVKEREMNTDWFMTRSKVSGYKRSKPQWLPLLLT